MTVDRAHELSVFLGSFVGADQLLVLHLDDFAGSGLCPSTTAVETTR